MHDPINRIPSGQCRMHSERQADMRKSMVALAITLTFVSSELSTSAFARGDDNLRYVAGSPDSGDDMFAAGFREHRPSNGSARDRDQVRGLDDGFSRYMGRDRYMDRDVWGHWGAYYGPMIHGP
jgi:hypothetical protein